MPTIGADPELFLRDRETGQVTPVCGLFGGTKGAPEPLPGMPDGYGVQEDNVMLEFNIPPASNPLRFDRSIGHGINALANLVHTRTPHLELDFGSARRFEAGQLDHPQASVFGCAPDFDAYRGGAARRAPDPETLGGWRFAGGHIHLGYEGREVPEHVVAQLCDLIIGLPSVAVDKQGERRRRYGRPGTFRPTPYGIEYRTLSNFWIFDVGLRHEMAERAMRVCNLAQNPDRAYQLFEQVPWRDVRSAILREIDDLAADLVAYARSDLNLEV